MQCLDINKQPLYYATLLGKEERVDSDGNYTGEYDLTYSDPVQVWMNISAARGAADFGFFGISLQYSKTMVTDDMECPINNDTVLWIDADPTTDKYNYVVKRVGKSLNYISYAIDEVS